MNKNWKHKDCWKLEGLNFLVEITRHEAERPDADSGEGPHWWAVYACIYPSHPLFAAFIHNGGIFQPATAGLPLHCGRTYHHCHASSGGRYLSHQVGSDYHHLYSQRFTDYATREEAVEVFSDAEKLFDHLSAIQPIPATTDEL